MRITESQLRKIVREEILREGAAFDWQEGHMGRMYLSTPKGTYDWSPTTGHLEFISSMDGRRVVLSKDLNSKRAGGFHNVKTQVDADARVQSHMGKAANTSSMNF